MHRKTLALLSLAVALGFVGCAQQDKNNMPGMPMAPMGQDGGNTDLKAALASGAVDTGNTVCPVSGDSVGDSKFIEVYDGKIYHFCCDMCPKDFKKDPAKFAKMVVDDPAKYGVKK